MILQYLLINFFEYKNYSMKKYLEYLLNEDSQNDSYNIDFNSIQFGGNNKINSKPSGSFPPIFLCDKSKSKESETKKTYQSIGTEISVMKIISHMKTAPAEKMFEL